MCHLFSTQPSVGRREGTLGYNPSWVQYALLCDLELLSFPFWVSVSFSENDIPAYNYFPSPSASCFKYNTEPMKNTNKADFRNRHHYHQIYLSKRFEIWEGVLPASM